MKLFRRKAPTNIPQPRTPRSSVSTMSYYNSRSRKSNQLGRKISPEKPTTRNKQSFVQHIPALFLLVAAVASLVFASTLNPLAKVAIVEESTTIRSEDAYRQQAEKFISQSPINRSKFLFDSEGLEESLKGEFPEIAAVTVTVPIMGRRPVVAIQTTKPAFILTSNSAAVLVGNNGIALANTNELVDLSKLSLRSVNDETGLDIEIGKPALPQEQALFISTIVEQLEKQQFRIESLTIPQSPYDLHVQFEGEKYYVKFNILEDPKQQAGAFVALKRTKLDKENITPRQYIDVRVGERVFYL